MENSVQIETMTYQQRIDMLRSTKLEQTHDNQQLIGSMDHDDHGLVLPAPERRRIVKTMSSSGMPITDCLLEGYEIKSNHPSGGFFGPRAVGENYGRLLRLHPVYTCLALAQPDIKKVIAYSSISQLGYVMLGLVSLDLSASRAPSCRW